MTAKYFWILFFLLIVASRSNAQLDSAYAIKYSDKLGVSIFQSKPSYKIDIKQKLTPDINGKSPLSYMTLAKYVTGVGLFYDKLSLFIGFKTPGDVEEQKRKGKTRFSQFNIAATGVKLRIEGVSRFYTGFYENNSPGYIPGFTDTSLYFQNSEMKNQMLKLKIFYFMNRKKRFSYGAAYVNNYRQLKSAGSFLFSANVYNYKLKSDVPLIPDYLSAYYYPWQTFNFFNATGISAGIGYTHTFAIFKRVFLNLLVTAGLEEQHLVFRSIDGAVNYNKWRLDVSAFDFRSSFGFNSNRFFISIQTIIDGNTYITPALDVTNLFINAFFNIGYRFGVGTPGIYKRIQQK